MRKKLLTTVLTVGVVLSLVGCGAKETTSSESVAETTVAESTTEYGTEETTEVVEETSESATEEVVEEQTTETTETVEETVVEEATEEVAETTGDASGYPMAFADDDPRTSTVTDLYASLGTEVEPGNAKIYLWNDGNSPMVVVSPGTEDIEELREVLRDYGDTPGVLEHFGTVSTAEGEEEVMLCVGTTVEGYTDYVYEFGGYTIKMSDQYNQISTVEDLQHFVDLIRFE